MRRSTLLACIIAVVSLSASQALAGSAGRCGGGNRTGVIKCPSGQYIVGFGVRRGQYVDSVTAQCQRIGALGEQLGRKGDTVTVGTGGGIQNQYRECDAGNAITQIRMFSGMWVDAIDRFRCSGRERDGSWSRAFIVSGRFGGTGSLPVGGVPCELQCPPGEALTSLKVKYGGWVDSIEGTCSR